MGLKKMENLQTKISTLSINIFDFLQAEKKWKPQLSKNELC
jgi:hypothetical protein